MNRWSFDSNICSYLKGGNNPLLYLVIDRSTFPIKSNHNKLDQLNMDEQLFQAIEQRNFDIALKLIAGGANPRFRSEIDNLTPIAIASAHGSTEVIQALIDAGADVNCFVRNITVNNFPIRKEAGQSLLPVFKVLENLGEMIESVDDIDDSQINIEFVKQKVDGKIDRIQSNWQEQQSLYRSSETAIDTYPIIIASRFGNSQAVEILLQGGANPRYRDGEGKTAYDWAVKNQYRSVLSVLKSHGITSNGYDPDFELLLAIEFENACKVKAFLVEGADVNGRDDRRQTRDQTPLMLAIRTCNIELVDILLEAGADLTLTDRRESVQQPKLPNFDRRTLLNMGYRLGDNALTLASRLGYTSIVQILLEEGANPNYQDQLGNTAVLFACHKNHFATVKVLIEGGADITLPNHNKETCLMVARQNGYVELIEFLRSQS